MHNVLKRTTLIVRDVGRSMQFYRDVLGLSVWYDDEIVLSGHGLAAGGPGDRTRLVIMQAQDPVIGMLGILDDHRLRAALLDVRDHLWLIEATPAVHREQDVSAPEARPFGRASRLHVRHLRAHPRPHAQRPELVLRLRGGHYLNRPALAVAFDEERQLPIRLRQDGEV